MIQTVTHIGIIVSDIRKSIHFYQDILGMYLQGEMEMKGRETDFLFNKKRTQVKLAYLSPEKKAQTPLIELMQFSNKNGKKWNKGDFNATGISEVCFIVQDIEKTYKDLCERGVIFLSNPQFFDYSSQGFGRSKAVYFRDPDGTILELLQTDI